MQVNSGWGEKNQRQKYSNLVWFYFILIHGYIKKEELMYLPQGNLTLFNKSAAKILLGWTALDLTGDLNSQTWLKSKNKVKVYLK